MTPDVLLDLTPLDTTSRYRGIGKYASCLGRAIHSLSPSERHGLEIAALIGLYGERTVGALTWPGSPAGVHEGQKLAWTMNRRLRLGGTLRRLSPRLFHATEPVGTPRGSRVPRIVTCHDLLNLVLCREYYPGRRIYPHALRLIEAARHHPCRRVIAISEYTAGDLMRILRFPAARIDVVPQGVEHDRFRPPATAEEARVASARRDALGIGGVPYLVYVGGADPRKSVGTLISAFVRAAQPDLDLVLVGRYCASEEVEVLAAIHAEGNPKSIRRLGFVADESIPAVLSGATALAFPSIYEGFGLPVLEAMASGCPVIAVRATSIGEVAGSAALYVPPRDSAALAAAIREITTDAALRSDLRSAGLAQAAKYSWRATALGTVDAYARALRA